MTDCETARQIALSLPEATEQDHVGRPSFRVKGKIFSTLWEQDNRVMVKLALDKQTAFVAINPAAFFPVPGEWGGIGMTFIQLEQVAVDLLEDALTAAWRRTAPRRLAAAYDRAKEEQRR